ncbi:MAG: cellobiose epimerase [Fusobacteriaceae bacterium]|nr:cellobiose epimerase [Fusobacteriaceae bacterium]
MERLKKLKEDINQELLNICKFWIENSIDKENGGFYGEIYNNNIVNKTADKGIILNTRLLWSFSRMYNFSKDKQYLIYADRAYEYLIENFLDKKNGGFFWLVDNKGNKKNARKQVYAQAFAIYALSEYYKTNKNKEVVTLAKDTFALIEKYCVDKNNKGYFEALSEKWEEIEDVRLSAVDMNEKKSNNTHLHVMEAYTTFYEITKDNFVKERLSDLVEIMLNKIMNRETYNFTLFFDEKWNKKSNIISCGHEIEAAWLIYHALEIIGDKGLLEKYKKDILIIIENSKKYISENGKKGMYNEILENGEFDKDKIWWVQAEACIGFTLGYQLTNDKNYIEIVENIWEFTKEYIIDQESGEWFWYGNDCDTEKEIKEKVCEWKSMYHNSRACIEVIERINKILDKK